MKNKLAFFGGKPILNKSIIRPWPNSNENDMNALSDVINTNKFHRVNHPIVTNLEKYIEDNYNYKSRVASSCTATLHITHDYLYDNGYKYILLSPLNWPGAIGSSLISNMKPLFVDISEDDCSMNEDAILNILKNYPNEKICIQITHLFGNHYELPKIRNIDSEFIQIVDDCAQHISFIYDYTKTKNKNIILLSGNGAKHLASGELGILCTNNVELINHVDYVSLSSSDRNGHREFSPSTLGYNYRPNVFSTSIALNRIKQIEDEILFRRNNSNFLSSNLFKLKGLKPLFNSNNLNSYCAFPIKIDFENLGLPERGEIRDKIVTLLEAEGVPVSVWLKEPVWNYLPLINQFGNYDINQYPNTNKLLKCMFQIKEVGTPNGISVMELYVEAFNKVWNNLEFVKDWLNE